MMFGNWSIVAEKKKNELGPNFVKPMFGTTIYRRSQQEEDRKKKESVKEILDYWVKDIPETLCLKIDDLLWAQRIRERSGELKEDKLDACNTVGGKGLGYSSWCRLWKRGVAKHFEGVHKRTGI